MDDRNTSQAGQASAAALIQDLRAAVSIGRPLLHSDVDEVESALAARQPVGWQPMESAPKDGTEILIEVEWRAGIRGKCLVGHYMAGGYCIEDHPPIAAGWYFWNGSMFDRAAKPMRWMHIPPAQAVDLAQFRVLAAKFDGLGDEEVGDAYSGPYYQCALELRALIDSQEMGREPNSAPNRLTDPAQAVGLGTGVQAIAGERERQLCVEGFSPACDAHYLEGELARAATAYAQLAAMDLQAGTRSHIASSEPPFFWPWAPERWKPVDARRDLVRAGALIAAQIDLIDSQAVRNG